MCSQSQSWILLKNTIIIIIYFFSIAILSSKDYENTNLESR